MLSAPFVDDNLANEGAQNLGCKFPYIRVLSDDLKETLHIGG